MPWITHCEPRGACFYGSLGSVTPSTLLILFAPRGSWGARAGFIVRTGRGGRSRTCHPLWRDHDRVAPCLCHIPFGEEPLQERRPQVTRDARPVTQRGERTLLAAVGHHLAVQLLEHQSGIIVRLLAPRFVETHALFPSPAGGASAPMRCAAYSRPHGYRQPSCCAVTATYGAATSRGGIGSAVAFHSASDRTARISV